MTDKNTPRPPLPPSPPPLIPNDPILKTDTGFTITGPSTNAAAATNIEVTKYFPSSVNFNADPDFGTKTSCSSEDRNKINLSKVSFPNQSCIPDSHQFIESEKHFNPDDVCCIALLCIVHRRIALIEIENKALFLPFVQFNADNLSVNIILNDFLRKIIDIHCAKFRNSQLTKIDRIQFPKNLNYVSRFMYRIEIENSSPAGSKTSNTACVCQMGHKATIQWLSQSEVLQRANSLWGMEPKFVFDYVNKSTDDINQANQFAKKNRILLNEYSVEDMFTVIELDRRYEIVKCCEMTNVEMYSLYNEYLVQCYPAFGMTFSSFKMFMGKLGFQIKEARLLKYFKAFDTNRQQYLNFDDLLLGLAAMKTRNDCGHEYCLQTRHEYLFRFYHSNECNAIVVAKDDDRLSQADFGTFLMDLLVKEPSESNQQFVLKLSNTIAERFKLKLDDGLPFADYYRLVKNPEFMQLLRSDGGEAASMIHVHKLLQIPFNPCNIILPKFLSMSSNLTPVQWLTMQQSSDQKCDSCKRIKFHLSSHFIVLSEIGEVNEINRLDDNSGPPTTSSNDNAGLSRQFKHDIQESDIHVLANDLINRINKVALFIFHPEDIVNTNNDLHNLVENWFFPSKAETINNLKMIANKAEELFSQETRVLSLSTPCYVFGDIHGNLRDLLSFSQILWKPSPFINQSKYLFLGDYVDRGQYGVECIIYLFCMKILAPHNFFLLRGNHEIREIQEQFSFWAECSGKFSGELWDIINMAFERLPVAAVIDDRIYCAHGGIPVTVTTLDQIRSIPSPLDNPLIQSIEAWEMLWNDPISKDEFIKLSDFERNFSNESRGFARNTKRGTAYLYTEYAVQQFFARNNIEQIIRAHEVFEDGYHFHHQGQVLTVFSSSKYADLNNRAGVIFIDRNKLRIIQIIDDQ